MGNSFKENNFGVCKYTKSPHGQYLTGHGDGTPTVQKRKKKKQLKIALNEINFSTAWKVQAQSILWIIQC